MRERPDSRTPAVSSPRNPAIQRARRLERDRSERERCGSYVVWGLHLAQEAVLASASIERAFVSDAATKSAGGRALIDALSRSAPVVRTTDRVLESIATGAGDQGVVLVVSRPSTDLGALIATRPTLLLLAHGVQDPGNLGSMVRTALALGAGALIALEGCTDLFAGRVARSAMGALFRLPVLAGDSPRVLAALRAAGLTIIAADVGGRSRPDRLDLRPPIALLVGSEARGLPPEILAGATARVRIPMSRGCASLNVHAAAAALLYEAMRQRGFPDAR